jgi:hypothetical protein
VNKVLMRTTIAAGTLLFVAGAPLAAAAQMAPEATAAVMAPVRTPAVLLRGGVGIPLSGARRQAAPDPLSNGARNGAIVGAIGAGTIFGVIAWRSCEDTVCQVGVPLIWAGIGAGVGALVGLAIDRAHESGPSASRGLSADVAPIVSPSRRGLGVTLRW